MNLREKKIVVVGLGKSGRAAALFLAKEGAHVVANDAKHEAEFGPELDELKSAGVPCVLGGHPDGVFSAADLVVVSPGVPPLAAVDRARARGVRVVSEVELASWFVRGTILGVTGTNGKSTVTTLLGEMCRASGRPTFIGGNLGTPLVDVIGTAAAGENGFVVVELSSFQLERIESLRCHVAILLNVTDDHLDRYPSFAAYAAAKARIFENQRVEDHALVPDGDALCEPLARASRAHVHFFGGTRGEVRTVEDRIEDTATGWSFPSNAVGIRGAHNLSNACVSILAARLVGIEMSVVETVLRSFKGLPHRMTHVRDLDGVAYYDDSKATNVGATITAIDGLREPLVLILGGKDKGGSYEPLRQRIEARCRAVITIGEAASVIETALRNVAVPLQRARDMDHAVQLARAAARAGDAVLLAPACASFDMFRSYAHRGDEFARAVHELSEKTEARP